MRREQRWPEWADHNTTFVVNGAVVPGVRLEDGHTAHPMTSEAAEVSGDAYYHYLLLMGRGPRALFHNLGVQRRIRLHERANPPIAA